MSQTPIIHVKRRINASPERVFDAWLNPVWMFGAHARDEQIVSLEIDPRVGGTFHYKVRRDGVEIDHTGTYRVIERPRLLEFTWGVDEEQGDRSVVTISLAADGDGCLLTLTHKLHSDWAEYAERTQAGWTKIVGDLADALA